MTSVSTDRRFGINSGMAIKVPVTAATTAAITLSGEQTIDGVACVTDDRVLVKNQSTTSDNGIYVVDTGTWTRSTDFDGSYDIVQGTLIPVAQGTVSAGQVYRITSANPLTIDSSSLAFDFALSASTLSFLQSGTGALATDLQTRGRKVRYVTDYYANGSSGAAVDSTGVVDSAGGIQAAINAGAAVIYFPAGTYLIGSQLSVALDGIRFELMGATLKKGFNGNLFAVSAAQFAIDGHGTVDGQSVTYTGKGVVFSGSSSNPLFGSGILFKAFADAHIEFGADAGKYADIFCDFNPDAVQTDYLAVSITGTDSAAAYRKIIGSIAVGGYHNFVGAQDTYVSSSGFKRIVTDSTCSITKVSNCRWGNGGTAMTVSGTNTDLIGNKFAGNVTLDANWSGVFEGNEFTSGSLTVSATGVNSVVHKAGSVFTIGLTSYYANGAYRVLGDKVTSCGDQDQTFAVGGNGPTMQYKSTLSANRIVTLSTTGAVNGDWCLVTRTGGDSGGPWTVSVGGLKSLSQNQWALAKYDGSVWFLAQYGTL